MPYGGVSAYGFSVPGGPGELGSSILLNISSKYKYKHKHKTNTAYIGLVCPEAPENQVHLSFEIYLQTQIQQFKNAYWFSVPEGPKEPGASIL